jgi:hypothetical protein
MLKNIFLVLILAISLQAKDGLSQEHLLLVSPEVSAQEVSAQSSVEIVFDLPIAEKSVHKDTITLRSENKHKKDKEVRGSTTLKDEKTLLFTPSEALENGTYKVKVQELKLQDFSDKHTNRFQKYSHKMCSYFYDDVKKCFLYRYASSVKTKHIKYSFSIDDNKPKVTSITLNKSNIQLNEDNTTTISVNAEYDDNTTVDVTDEVEWIISNSSIVSIDKGTITPLSEGSTTLQAKYNNQTTPEITLTVYKEINGYKLPPEPDETLNNSTLLGIDVNSNGVLDDVERKIIETYREPVKIELVMATAKVGQEILENPVGLAKEHSDKMDRLDNCGSYLENQNISYDGLESIRFYERNIYNTKTRVRAYLDYNVALSGGVYGSSPADWVAESCDFDVDAMLGTK